MARFERGEPGRPALSRVGGPTLWDILTEPDPIHAVPADPAEAVRQDVLRNIQTILSARRGRCVGYPDYGLPDPAEYLVSGGGLMQLAREVKRAVERWEPRVARPVDVRVATEEYTREEARDGAFRAILVIRARLAAPYSRLCTFRTTILPDGHTEVEG